MTPFKKGQSVQQDIKPLKGTVLEIKWNDTDETFEYLVDLGDGAQRWFNHSEIVEAA
jgi:hypothetical protein